MGKIKIPVWRLYERFFSRIGKNLISIRFHAAQGHRAISSDYGSFRISVFVIPVLIQNKMASRLVSSLARYSKHCAGLRSFPGIAHPERSIGLRGRAAVLRGTDQRRYAASARSTAKGKPGQAGFLLPRAESHWTRSSRCSC